jgi:hypothetical protein
MHFLRFSFAHRFISPSNGIMQLQDGRDATPPTVHLTLPENAIRQFQAGPDGQAGWFFPWACMTSREGQSREQVAGKFHLVTVPADLTILGAAQAMRATSCDCSNLRPAP